MELFFRSCCERQSRNINAEGESYIFVVIFYLEDMRVVCNHGLASIVQLL